MLQNESGPGGIFLRLQAWMANHEKREGDIGTGFTDQEREQFTEEFIINKTIEVSCMMLTPDGKFRHPRYERLREDK